MFDGDLRWGVKRSFVRYVEVAGGIEVLAPGWRDVEAFRFPLVQRRADQIQFSGGVAFRAHRGLLSLTLQDPWIEFDEEGGAILSVLYVANRDSDGERVIVADVSADGSTTLTASGVSLFDSEYAPGTELDPLTFVPSI